MESSLEFFKHDFMSTLFPMETCRFIIEEGQSDLIDYIEKCVSNEEADNTFQFLAQTRVYASKTKNHLRRTVKLDPVAEFFIYHIIYRNRSKFRKPFDDHKKHFGYRFQDGEPIQPNASYTGFKQALVAYEKTYAYSMSFDVAFYFNSIYHHDLSSWFANVNASDADVSDLGTFLRQINSGTSIDCLPQGIYPTKMIGNDFLRFVEQHHKIKSNAVVRFMDDFVLFSDDRETLLEDFFFIQQLLGSKNLSVNPSKTSLDATNAVKVGKDIDDVKAKLLRKRRNAAALAYDGEDAAALEASRLDNNELQYIRDLLKRDNLEEEDAELILSLFREHPDEVMPHLGQFAVSFPHLAKSIWSFCRFIDDKTFIGKLVLESAKSRSIQEYQLFWFAWILQDHLLETNIASQIISALYEHRNASDISKSKILEIPDNRYGLIDLRDEHLVAGKSGWLSWASAVGHKTLPAISRNHKLKYFAHSSQMNFMISKIVSRHSELI